MMSDENLQRFERILATFDATLARQEEIISKLFDTEADIAKLRIGHLDDYFDSYSSGLDKVASKTSGLSDVFKVLAQLAANVNKDIAATSTTARGSTTYTRTRSSGPSGDGSDGGGPSKKSKNAEVSNSIPKGNRKQEPDNLSDVAAKWAKFFANHNPEERDNLTEADQGIVSQAKLAEGYKAHLKGIYEAQAKTANELHKQALSLEIARYNRTKHEELALAELTTRRLEGQKAAQAAELELQTELNKVLTNREYETGSTADEAANTRSREVDSKEKLKSLQEVEAKRLKWKEEQEISVQPYRLRR